MKFTNISSATSCEHTVPEVHNDKSPVEVQVDGYKEEVVVKDVHILGPVAHRGVPAVQQLRVEVRVHSVHLGTNRKYNMKIEKASVADPDPLV